MVRYTYVFAPTKAAIALLQIQFIRHFLSFMKTPSLGWISL
jgi:hypothetical protein